MFVEYVKLYDSWLLTAASGAIVFIIVDYWLKVRSYPRGPLPLPFLGNLLAFRGNDNIISLMENWRKTYGDIFTVWFGVVPAVIVNTYDLNYEASVTQKGVFANRPNNTKNALFRGVDKNIINSNGKGWEILRKVGHVAARKFAFSKQLPPLIKVVCREVCEAMVKEKQPLNPDILINITVYNIICSIATGKSISITDEAPIKQFKQMLQIFVETSANGLPQDSYPFLRPLLRYREDRLDRQLIDFRKSFKASFLEHKQSFKRGTIRDFADAALNAREEALEENSDEVKYLTDDNMFMVVNDLISAGVATTQTTLRWMVLLMASYPNIQEMLYNEVIEKLGTKEVFEEDKHYLPFTNAFIKETLRFTSSVPFGLDHETTVDTTLGGHNLPKGTQVYFNLYHQNHDPKYWKDPENFDPNRFLDTEGSLITSRLPSYVPFGLGRRACIGEKLAITDIFYIVVNLVRSIKFELPDGPDSGDLEPIATVSASDPKPYLVNCMQRK